MDFFRDIEQTILAAGPDEKIRLFRNLYENWCSGFYPAKDMCDDRVPLVFETPSFSSFCRITEPEEVGPRNNIGKSKGRQALLHSFAHIEYNAIDLALDAVYRFRNMPEQFISDWLEVAREEVEHFQGIATLLHELDTAYGEFPVHTTLFDISMKALNLKDRMAVVPRHLEAIGLDVNPLFITRFSRMGDPQALRIEKLLRVILEDEIGHVKKGDNWFRYECGQSGGDPEDYFAIVTSYRPGAFPLNRAPNREARLRAGFSEAELDRMERKAL